MRECENINRGARRERTDGSGDARRDPADLGALHRWERNTIFSIAVSLHTKLCQPTAATASLVVDTSSISALQSRPELALPGP